MKERNAKRKWEWEALKRAREKLNQDAGITLIMEPSKPLGSTKKREVEPDEKKKKLKDMKQEELFQLMGRHYNTLFYCTLFSSPNTEFNKSGTMMLKD